MALANFTMNNIIPLPPPPELRRQAAEMLSWILWKNRNENGPLRIQAFKWFLSKKLPSSVKYELLPNEYLQIIRARTALRRLCSFV